MGAQLASTVYVKDPDSHQTVTLEPGTCPEPRLAALVTNPSAWVDGKLPRLPKTQAQEGNDPGGDGPGAASGDASALSAAADTTPEPAQSDTGTGTKPAAKKAATRPARGRTAAAEGTGGQ